MSLTLNCYNALHVVTSLCCALLENGTNVHTILSYLLVATNKDSTELDSKPSKPFVLALRSLSKPLKASFSFEAFKRPLPFVFRF